MSGRRAQSLTLVVALGTGALFGFGLVLSGMTKPEKVLAFLDPLSGWDPSLLFVMGGAVAVYAVGYRLIRRLDTPLAAERFDVPSTRRLDSPLIGGAVLFGLGWGLSGYCPGPAVVGLGAGAPGTFVFVAGVVLGTYLVNAWRRSRAQGAASASSSTLESISDASSVRERALRF